MRNTVSVIQCFLDRKDYNRPNIKVVLANVTIVEAMRFTLNHPNDNLYSYTIHRDGAEMPDASTLYATAHVMEG